MDTTQETKIRDNNLDVYRGWVMLYIVGVVHCILSLTIDWYSDSWATLLLLEMPVIFYISGAAYTLSHKKPYGRYVLGRIKRIIIPISIYLFTLVMKDVAMGEYDIKDSFMWYVRYWIQTFIGRSFEISHLWFIRPYLIIALLLPLLHYMSQKVNRYTIYLLLPVVMVALYFYPSYVLCYAIPTWAGLYYHKDKPYNIYIILLIVLCGIILCLLQGYTWNMQLNKFPANLMFASYTLSVLIILHKPLSWACLQAARIPVIGYIVKQYAQHDFTIYLYHTYAIAGFYRLYNTIEPLLPFHTSAVAVYSIMAIITIPLMIPVAKMMDYINGKVSECISWSYHKCIDRLSQGKENG